ncbi:lipid-A-disaccharide synthase-related protein [Synechococcus sp. PCC 7336]|uniref:lipid-A-disaccharide synthase-related protein n=1 Tax=Synechococcus sp. PCC 7336 TaxID=195250 RepID=UPI0003477C0C|nr:lipid-A-disaccharide synthase-related protein [Synechococcus sp. PCC 7336]
MSAKPAPRILCLSNGHGEDHIASRVAVELRQLGAEVSALPVVGVGQAYRNLDIEIVGPVQAMPSGGFVYMDIRQFWRDLKGGLGGLTWRQLQTLKQWGGKLDLVLAVGDIVVQAFARWSGARYAFIGTAKSDYYLRNEDGPYSGWNQFRESVLRLPPCSVYLPWERWLMRSPHCLATFPRDRLTAEILKQYRLPVFDLGNPMMDGLNPAPPLADIPSDRPAILLLPGSRPPEAYRNFALMAEVAGCLGQLQPPPTQPPAFYAAIATSLDERELQQRWPQHLSPITLMRHQFGSCLHRANVAIAMAGTASEQCVGLGKPVVTLPGQGPQFTPAFAEAQQRLLGPSLFLTPNPEAAARQIVTLLGRPPRLQENARRRMGPPGASQRIARQLFNLLESLS